MYTIVTTAILLIFLTSGHYTLDVQFHSNTPDVIPKARTSKGITLKVALYPFLPDSAGDNFANLTRFIREEFVKVQPDIDLQLRPLSQDADFYSLATLKSWLLSNGEGYDIVEIDTVLLGDVVNAGLIAPIFPIPDNHSDWHPTAARAVQFNQVVYGYPHLMCANFLFTRNEQVAQVKTLDQLIHILGSTPTDKYRLIGNLNSSWDLPGLWVNSYQNSNGMGSDVQAFAVHSYQTTSFESMRKLSQLCERSGGENYCLNGVFRNNATMIASLFATKQAAAMIGYSERLFLILKNTQPDDYLNIKIIPLTVGSVDNQPIYFTDAFVFRRNMSDDVANAARSFVEFMNTPRMQAAVVGSEDSINPKLRYLLPVSRNAFNEPILANDRFYQQYFRNLSVGYPFTTLGFPNARQDIQKAIYVDKVDRLPGGFMNFTCRIHFKTELEHTPSEKVDGADSEDCVSSLSNRTSNERSTSPTATETCAVSNRQHEIRTG
ncbi:unnamed protein product [Adineta ricciae]|uniref:Thiamine pyridinylase n=1 Tax=Adineta ricciae TaxID=249248 RepID=A0A815DM57_ADIRI|nr:unnamed protein product [Adineta ricciae]CAF1303402.1 unnamed protein product [Adineta ricciae]